MKKVTLILSIIMIFSNYLLAQADILEKITKFYYISTNGIINFKSKKIKKDIYELKINSTNIAYESIFNPNYTIKVYVDDGPFVTKPKITFAKAGLLSNINLAKLFSKDIQKDLNKTLKNPPLLKYEAVVSFSNILNESFKISPLTIEDKNLKIYIDEIKAKSRVDLDKFTGKIDIINNKIELITSDKKANFLLEGLSIHNEITNKPINNIALFGKSGISFNSIDIKVENKKRFHLKFAFNLESEIKKVDNNTLDFSSKIDTTTNDIDTIALSHGIKESHLNLLLKNLGINGVLELIKLNNKIQDLQNKLSQNLNDPLKKEAALAEYMSQIAILNNKFVDIFNKTFITNKSRINLDLKLLSDKINYIKLNLLYKAKPLKGDINNAMISLLAQGLAIFDGDFDIRLEKDLISSINPLSILFIEMLKNKGFVKENNGVYELKGSLKDGKIILNGKSYTLEELSKTLF